MKRTWLVPIFRHLIAGLVALGAGWVLNRFGVEITAEQQDFLTGTLTTFGAFVCTGIWITVTKWMKPWFLRHYHPADGQPRRLL